MWAWMALAAAALPAVLCGRNLRAYRPLPPMADAAPRRRCSVLIPARNEEANLAEAVAGVLRNRDVEIELIVMDDGSTDRTAAILRELAAKHPELRVAEAPPLPDGWCGKQHVCWQLAQLATGPALIFVDADVRLASGALGRMVQALEGGVAGLLSGVPRQITGTFSEKLLIPLIHFVLLGFLPMQRMRASTVPAYAAGCGQLFVAKRADYFRAGGHARLGRSLHDGLNLPRIFRQAGIATDLFDATDVASCRMYATNGQVWEGLARCANEAMAAPGRIGPFTVLLFAGQVLPFWLLAPWTGLAPLARCVALLAVAAAYGPRIVCARRFHQSALGVFLHPLGVLGLLAIQWFAFFRKLRARPATWKGRDYTLAHRAVTSETPG